MKTCKHCGKHAHSLESLDKLFSSNGIRNGKRRYKNVCKACHNESTKIRNSEAYRADRSSYLLYKYGIDEQGYNEMFKAQEGCCAICKKHQTEFKKKLAVDHCHETGEVRGLLCTSCNQALGLLQDSTTNLKNAFEYLGGVSSVR
jgi:hypothetical protein